MVLPVLRARLKRGNKDFAWFACKAKSAIESLWPVFRGRDGTDLYTAGSNGGSSGGARGRMKERCEVAHNENSGGINDPFYY